jgi:large subunit ribosomal protein L5
MTDTNLKTRLKEEIYPKLGKELGIANPMAIPRLQKVVINIGIPKSDTTKKDIEVARTELTTITGQLAKVSGAKQSIAGFKIRAGDPVGVNSTLRGERMLDFLDKLCRIVLPQVKDFRGVKQGAFDGHGNYTLGLSEQIIFPEIDYAKIDKIRGLEITIVTSTSNNEHAYQLLAAIGMPFAKEEQN